MSTHAAASAAGLFGSIGLGLRGDRVGRMSVLIASQERPGTRRPRDHITAQADAAVGTMLVLELFTLLIGLPPGY